MCIAARCSVAFTGSPANSRVAKRLQLGRFGQGEQRLQAASSMPIC